MRAYNSRKTPREIYLFRKRGQKITLTEIETFFHFLDSTVERKNVHITLKVIRENKVELIKARFYERFTFGKQLLKILHSKPKEVSISSMIACFKGINDRGKCIIDFSKVQRKDFVSRDMIEIINLLKEKGILKEKGVEN